VKQDPRTREQDRAARALKTELSKAPRAQFAMATGAGKTRVAVSVLDTYEKAIVFVPNVRLVAQVLSAYHKFGKNNRRLAAVCSAPITIDGLEVESLRSAEEISEVVKIPGRLLVVSTYQSVDKIVKGCKKFTFDILVADEAHHTAGFDDKTWARVLSDQQIAARKRLFMTATTKTYNPILKQAGKLNCQSDVRIYGRNVYQLSYKRAVELGIINDYRVTIFIDNEDLIPAKQRKLPSSAEKILARDHDGRIPTTYEVTLIASALRECVKQKYTKILAYANRVDDARFYGDLCTRVADLLRKQDPRIPKLVYARDASSGSLESANVFVVEGVQGREIQGAVIDRFQACRGMSILVSCRAASEGTDIPKADTTLLLARREAEIDLSQIIGRTSRLHASKNKPSMVFLPAIVASQDDFDMKGEFARVRRTLERLAAYDDSWQVEINALVEFTTANKISRTALSPRLSLSLPSERVHELATKIRGELWSTDAEARQKRYQELADEIAQKMHAGEVLGDRLAAVRRAVVSAAKVDQSVKIDPILTWNPQIMRAVEKARTIVSLCDWPVSTSLHGRWLDGHRQCFRKGQLRKEILAVYQDSDKMELLTAVKTTRTLSHRQQRVAKLVAFCEKHGRQPSVRNAKERKLAYLLNNMRMLAERGKIELPDILKARATQDGVFQRRSAELFAMLRQDQVPERDTPLYIWVKAIRAGDMNLAPYRKQILREAGVYDYVVNKTPFVAPTAQYLNKAKKPYVMRASR